MSLSVELVSTVLAFEDLKVDWNNVVSDMDFPEIFYRWEWNYYFFQRYGKQCELFIVVVKESSGRIVGIAPFCIRRTRRMGLMARVLGSIIVEIGDYRNVLIRGESHRGKVVKAVLDLLHEHCRLWDVLDI